jgi:3-methyl-2-oxobutanoate hydroxymethyltransferase
MRVTIQQIRDMKKHGEKIPMLTAYDYPTARILDEAGIPLLLVGDSLGNVVLGYETTVPVTLDDMIHHTKAVARGAKTSHIIGDMPFLTYQTTIPDALRNAGRFMQDAGAHSVKLEGGAVMAETVNALVERGIPVMGHIGLTPQSVNQIGLRAQGRTIDAAQKLLKDAEILQDAGAYALVLEAVPATLAKMITERLSIPTIGIGAGPDCDGQVQVISDMLGLFTDFVPKHVKQYAHLAESIREAINTYKLDVAKGSFPTHEHSFTFNRGVEEELMQELKKQIHS